MFAARMLRADFVPPRLRRVNAVLRAAAAAILGMLTSCSALGYPIADLADEINATRSHGRVVIAAGDTLRLRFAEKADWDQDVRVRSDGIAVFPVLDEVVVVGLTLPDLDKRLSERYVAASQTVGPLSVDLAQGGGGGEGAAAGGGAAGDVVFVIGDVESPGPMPMPGRPLTLIEAIAAAGGHTKQTANLRNTILTRRLVSGEMRSWRLDADIYQWGRQPPIWLQPRDIVFVPNSAIDEIDIWVDNYFRRMIPLPTLFPAP